jgi:4'-phosphopantetheinyl transferase
MQDPAGAIRLDVDADISMWVVDLGVEPKPADVSLLDDSERSRHARFRNAGDGRRYRAAHVALRRLLADASGIPMLDQRFTTGEFGKPSLANAPTVAFSLSYAGDVGLIGIGVDRPIGVDIEARRWIDDVESLAEDVFIDRELDRLTAISPGAARCVAFLTVWTRKEACIKALGNGLSASLRFDTGDVTARDTTVHVEDGRTALKLGSFAFNETHICAWAQRL